MALEVSSVQNVEVAEKANAPQETKEAKSEQTFAYEATEDDKNMGLRIEGHEEKIELPLKKELNTAEKVINGIGRGVLVTCNSIAGTLSIVGHGVYGLLVPGKSFDSEVSKAIQQTGDAYDDITNGTFDIF